MENASQDIRHALSELPEHIQHAVNIFNWEQIIPSIAAKYNIQLDEASIYERETMKVVVGLSSSQNYKKSLMKAMNINAQLAESLVLEANTHIFRELQRLAFKDEAESPNDVHSTFKDEGIHLIDHDEDMTVDLGEKPKREVLKQITKQQAPTTSQKTSSSYYEEISEDDLIGIHGHRIQTETGNTKKIYTTEEELHGKTHISKGDHVQVESIDSNHIDSLKNKA